MEKFIQICNAIKEADILTQETVSIALSLELKRCKQCNKIHK